MDLDVIKQRLEALQKPASNNNNNGKSLFWKPSVGKQTVRIVPSKFNKATPFSELYFHYGIGKPVMISPINFDEKDPLVEFAKKLRQTDQPENWKLAKKARTKSSLLSLLLSFVVWKMKVLRFGNSVKSYIHHFCQWQWMKK